MLASLLSLSIIFPLLICNAHATILTTSIDAGTVQGAKCPQNDASAFQSIPYARPPVGNLRFAPPQPFQGKFNGSSLNATIPAPACIQFGSAFLEQGPTSEDCLYLDLWVPPNANPSSNLPVKVWLYGGGDTAGGISDPAYNGCNMAMDNTLVVSINYRLGPLGFFALDAAGLKGNQAIQDILLGLQWVQDNIAAFGGNPKQVLLFGQSAGADNTYIVSTLPQAPKLIKAAISESGGGRATPPASAVQAFGAKYAQLLNCKVDDVACLRSIPISTLNSTLPLSTGLGIDGSPVTQFGPNVDGSIIPAQPATAGVQVPTIFGTTSREGTLFILASFRTKVTNLTNTDYQEFLSAQFAPSVLPLVTKQYPIAAFNSTPYPAFFALASIVTDAAYKCPAYRGLNTAVAKGLPAYTYLDAHTPSCEWIPGLPASALKLLGATHAAELPLVFNRLTGLENGTCSLSVSDGEISKVLVEAWTAMARSGDPSTSAVQWPRFSAAQDLNGVVINDTVAAGAVDYSACAFWDKIDALSLQLGTGAGVGKFGSNGTNATGAASPTTGAGGSTTSPVTFTGAAASWKVSGKGLLAGIAAAVVGGLAVF